MPPPRAHLVTYHGVLAPASALRAAITHGGAIRAILAALGLPTEPPAVHPARGPPRLFSEE